VEQEARALPAGDFQNVIFRPADAAHETLLKASMPSSSVVPSDVMLTTAGQKLRGRSRRTLRPVLQRVASPRSSMQPWVVLTSWTVAENQPANEVGNVSGSFAGDVETPSTAVEVGAKDSPSFHDMQRGRTSNDTIQGSITTFSMTTYSYAVVPTAGGWLVFQL
jgi:hypothetical protein